MGKRWVKSGSIYMVEKEQLVIGQLIVWALEKADLLWNSPEALEQARQLRKFGPRFLQGETKLFRSKVKPLSCEDREFRLMLDRWPEEMRRKLIEEGIV